MGAEEPAAKRRCQGAAADGGRSVPLRAHAALRAFSVLGFGLGAILPGLT